MKIKSVQSWHPCAFVIHTIYDIVKAHGGEIRVESLPMRRLKKEKGQYLPSNFQIIDFPEITSENRTSS